GWRTLDRLSAHVTAGQIYQFSADSCSGAAGEFGIEFLFTPAPTNDFFADRARLSGASVHVLGSSFAATKEAEEPDHAGGPGGASVWWTWTAPFDGVLLLTAHSAFTPLIGFY